MPPWPPDESAVASRDIGGSPAPESWEREAAVARGRSTFARPDAPRLRPSIDGLDSRLLFTLLAENVRDYAILLMDAHGVIRCWGEGARLMKWWTRDQAEGAHLRLLYPDRGAEDGTADAHLAHAAAAGEYNGEGHRVRSDGSLFWACVTLTALRDEHGRLVGFSQVARDFSARRSVETALQRAARAAATPAIRERTRLTQVIANLSHELRTPVNAIVGSVALLEEQLGHTIDDRAHLDRLHRSSRHLLAILDDVLQLSRVESGQLKLSPGERRLGPVIDDALADVEAQAAARGLVLTNAISGTARDLPYWGDDQRVRQIVVNLLVNAVKFTDPGGHITLSAGTGAHVAHAALAAPGPWVYVRVEDTGRGIAPDSLEMIFEPFHQNDHRDQQRGTGLGLAISRQLARLMGGDLVVESVVGEGSRFTLWLPITVATPVPR